MRSRLLLSVVLPLALSGCFVSRVDPEKPELPLPAALPAQADSSAATWRRRPSRPAIA